MEKWLFCDMPSICYWTAFSTYRDLEPISWQELFSGVLGRMDLLKERFDTNYLTYCFDSKESLRREALPQYKQCRKRGDDERLIEFVKCIKRSSINYIYNL
jgi:hypothetical protein